MMRISRWLTIVALAGGAATLAACGGDGSTSTTPTGAGQTSPTSSPTQASSTPSPTTAPTPTTSTSEEQSSGGQTSGRSGQTQSGKGNGQVEKTPGKPATDASLQGTWNASFTGQKRNRIRDGKWRLQFDGRRATFILPGSARSDVGSPTRVADGRISFRVAELCERRARGRYRATVSGRRLYMTPIKDACDIRRILLTGKWRR